MTLHLQAKMAVRLTIAAALAGSTLTAMATEIMPNFVDVPTGWNTDRYAPATFQTVASFQGRSDVLEIGISLNDGLDSRPLSYQSTFYNTQGKQHALAGTTGDTLSADLYISEAWRQGGSVRTDMWGVLTDGSLITGYPIIGFTNYGTGGGRYRVWDVDGYWVDLADTVDYGNWTSFSMELTGSSVEYFVNGVLRYSDSYDDNSPWDATGFSAVIMQAYNFDDPALTDAEATDYSVHWSNRQAVPEPGSLALVGLALACAAGIRRRGHQSK